MANQDKVGLSGRVQQVAQRRRLCIKSPRVAPSRRDAKARSIVGDEIRVRKVAAKLSVKGLAVAGLPWMKTSVILACGLSRRYIRRKVPFRVRMDETVAPGSVGSHIL